MPENLLQKFLVHESPQTTQVYYEPSRVQVKRAFLDAMEQGKGYTEANFAPFAMLGKRFCPRIRGLSKQRIYHADPERDYGALRRMLERRDRRLRLDWAEEQWNRIGQFFCSMATGHSTASVAMKRLVAFGAGNHLYRAVRELDRGYKTLFILDFLSRPALRHRVRRGLLKSEELHALARSRLLSSTLEPLVTRVRAQDLPAGEASALR